MRGLLTLAALLVSAILATGCTADGFNPDGTPTDDDDAPCTENCTSIEQLPLQFAIQINADKAFEAAIDNNMVEDVNAVVLDPDSLTDNSREARPIEVFAQDGSDDLSHPPCDINVVNQTGYVTVRNNELWAAETGNDVEETFEVQNNGVLRVNVVYTPWNGKTFDCTIGPSQDTVTFQTTDGQVMDNWLGPVIIGHELVNDQGDDGHFIGMFNSNFTEVDGTLSNGMLEAVVHCDQQD